MGIRLLDIKRIVFFSAFVFNCAFVYSQDTLKYPIVPTYDPTQTTPQSFDLGDPSSMQQTIVYDPITGTYIFTEVIGVSELNFRKPSMMTFDEYIEYERQKALRENWKERIDDQTEQNQPFELPIKVGAKEFENFFGRKIIGSEDNLKI